MKNLARTRLLPVLLAATMALLLQFAFSQAAFAEDPMPGGAEGGAPAVSVSSWAELAQAIDEAEGPVTIEVAKSFYLGSSQSGITIPAGKDITLAGNGTFIESSGLSSVLFNAQEGSSLTLGQGLKLNGGYHAPVVTSKGEVVLDGATISQAKGHAIKVSGAQANLHVHSGEIVATYGSSYRDSGLVITDCATAVIDDINLHDCWNYASGSAGIFISNSDTYLRFRKTLLKLNYSSRCYFIHRLQVFVYFG